MIRNITTGFLLVLFSFCMHAQDTPEFKTLLSSGEIPLDFLTISEEDFEAAAATQITDLDKRRTAKYKKTYLAKSNWYINRMLRGGSVLFNDPITQYVREVADYVLRDHEDLREELRFYTAKHESVNAFSTDAGVIIFNTGLIAQLENEAQLAFVIAHEIIHYQEKHGITGYIEERQVADEFTDYDSWSMDERLYLAKNQRSREMETEADKLGFTDFFAHTDYAKEAALDVMDVLQYSYLPFNEIKFSTSFITNQYFSLPENYLLEDLNPISVGDDYHDDLSTHPSVRKRRESLKEYIRLVKNKDGKNFIISEDRFYKVRKMARYETVRKHMVERDYPRAVYDAYIMMQDDPNDPYLRKVVAGALYGLSIYKSNHSDRPVVADYEDIEGESQQVYYLMDEMSDEWANVVALQYAWSLYRQYPGDRYLEEITEHLMLNLIEEEKLHLSDFYARSKEQIKAERDSLAALKSNDTLSEQDDEEVSKYDRIREKSEENALKLGEEEYRFAFVEMMQDELFIKAFDKAEEVAAEREDAEEITYEDFGLEKKRQKEMRKKMRTGQKIGIDKVLMVDPLYLSLDERKDEEILFFKTEEMQHNMSEAILWSSKQVGLEVVMLDPWSLTISDVDKYNDMTLVKDWMTEYFNHDDIEIVPFASNDLYPLMDNYGTRYLNWMGIISGREDGSGKFITGCGYLMIGLVPLAIYEWMHPAYEMLFFNILIDMEDANVEFSYRYGNDENAGKLRMKYRVYDIINQIKKSE
ncbi:MAG: M48 family metalloprotease [Bacteroidota bacterium]